MERKPRALALFSGGLDSTLAIRVIQEQGVEVIALNFVSHFFGGKNIKIENMAKQLGIQVEYIDFKKEHLKMVKDPVYGRGKNMNPCIDCHSLMFKIAGDLLSKYDADFLISGEVMGQRPMSQNSTALEKVNKLSGMGHLIVRPLSGKLLSSTQPIENGIIDKEGLLDIQGRSRMRQLQLIEKYGIVEYATPGGGCLLTDPSYSVRLKILEEDEFIQEEHSYILHLIKKTRFFRFGKGKYMFVGRDEESNQIISSYENKGYIQLMSKNIFGPRILLFGEFNVEEENLAGQIFSRYSKVKGTEDIEVRLLKYSIDSQDLVRDETLLIPQINLAYIEDEIKNYQIV